MEKEIYEAPATEIIRFETEDVITDSTPWVLASLND